MEKSVLELYQLGSTAFREERHDDARKHFAELARQGCEFADVYNMMGVISYEDGDYAAAKENFRKALEKNPRYTEAGLNLAVTLNDTGDYPDGETAFNQMRHACGFDEGGVDPYVKGKLANLHFELGVIYHGLGLYDDALQEFQMAVRLGPAFPDIRTQLGVLYRDMGRIDDAEEEFKRVKRQHPGYADAGVQLGITLFGQGFAKAAVEEWREVMKSDPENSKALMYLRLAERGPL